MKVDPTHHDAYLTAGVSEYLMGSMPFFVKWFVKFEQTQGSKVEAIKNLTLVAQKGRYLRPFAKVLLAVIHLREKRPLDAEILLGELNREYPDKLALPQRAGEVTSPAKDCGRRVTCPSIR